MLYVVFGVNHMQQMVMIMRGSVAATVCIDNAWVAEQWQKKELKEHYLCRS